MRYRIVAVGRRARDPLIDASFAYLDRLNRYAKAELLLVRDSDPESEGKALLAKVAEQDHLIALDERGRQQRTLEFAEHLDAVPRHQRVVFLVGGADGHSPSVRKRSDELLSLSRFTLPHRLVWATLLEQLYRAHTVLRGEAYHRE